MASTNVTAVGRGFSWRAQACTPGSVQSPRQVARGERGTNRARHEAVPARFAFLCLFFVAAALAGCGATLPQPSLAAPPAEAFVTVPYPPPAALSELVPPPPKGAGVVFQDGSWVWRGRYYVWQRGGWVQPPSGARLCVATLRYLPDGRAYFAAARWVDARGQLVRAPRILVPATSPPNEVTAEFQTGR